jgi:hypothetical protein
MNNMLINTTVVSEKAGREKAFTTVVGESATEHPQF